MIALKNNDLAELGAGFLRISKAILFADVVDSVRLVAADEEDTIFRWVALADKFEGRISAKGKGRLVKRMGDALLAEFSDVHEAALEAIELLKDMAEANENVDAKRRIELRVGVDVGEVLHSADKDLYGQHVNVAARLAAASRAGQITVSARVRDTLADCPDIEFEDIGQLHLKNVPRPVHAFLMHNQDLARRIVPKIAVKDLLPTIAVMPVTTPSATEDSIVWSKLLTEDIVYALAKTSHLNVISSLSTWSYRSTSSDLNNIGQVLGADFLLTATLRQMTEASRLDLSIVEATSGLVVWQHELEFQNSELLERNAIFSDLANMVHGALLNRGMARALSNPLPTLEGYAMLFGASALMNRLSRRDFDLAGDLLDGLIERIPNAPAALASKASWHVLKVQQGWTDDRMTEARLALEYTERALEIDAHNSAALVAEGFVRNNLLHDLETAQELYDSALELNPNDANGRAMRAALYTFRGDGTHAVHDAERALHISPLDPNRFFLQSLAAGASLANEDYERALQLATASFRLNRSHTSTLRVKAVAEWRLGQNEQARATVAKLLEKQPGFSVSWWLSSNPAADFEMGRAFAQSLKEIGVPD